MPRKSRRPARTSSATTEISFSEAEAIAALTAYAEDQSITVPDGDAGLIFSLRGDNAVKILIKES